MSGDFAKRLAELDPALTPEAIDAAYALYAPYVVDARVDQSDIAYGPDPRQKLDLYLPRDRRGAPGPAPLLLFVPGGGFTGGDKARPGEPFHGNVGRWAAERGAVAAVMNYRLAPDHPFPAGAEDVSEAAAWLRVHAGELGGDPGRLILMGHSAGASHVADCLVDDALRPDGLAAAVLVSGVYQPAAAPVSAGRAAYYAGPAEPALPRLATLDLPLVVAVAERDPELFRLEARALAEARGGAPHVGVDHTHITLVACLGAGPSSFGRMLAAELGLNP